MALLLLTAPVVQTSDSAIHQIIRYTVDKYLGNQLCYSVDSIIHLSNNWALNCEKSYMVCVFLMIFNKYGKI